MMISDLDMDPFSKWAIKLKERKPKALNSWIEVIIAY